MNWPEHQKGTFGKLFSAWPSQRRTRACRIPVLLLVGLLASLVAARARDFPPDAPPPKPLVLPVPQVRRLSNGLKIVAIERRSLPLLSLRLVVKSGAEADPPALAGTAQFVAGLLTQEPSGAAHAILLKRSTSWGAASTLGQIGMLPSRP